MEKLSISNEAWDHSNRDLMTNSFNLWSKNFSLLKASAYTLSIYTKASKFICQPVLFFLSNSLNFHSMSRFLTEARNTHFSWRLLREMIIALLSFHNELKCDQIILHCIYKGCIYWPLSIPSSLKYLQLRSSPKPMQKKNRSQGSLGFPKLFNWEYYITLSTLRFVVQLDTETTPPILFPK